MMACFECKMCLPVTSWPCISRLTLITEQLSFVTKVACGAEAVVVSTVEWSLLKLLLKSKTLFQSGESQVEEEEEKTQAS